MGGIWGAGVTLRKECAFCIHLTLEECNGLHSKLKSRRIERGEIT